MDDEMKLSGLFSRGHKPDIDALSALVDGALDATTARTLEAHVASCDACTAELDGLRSVKSMLAALPQVEPTRSFRVRLADIEAPAKPARARAAGLLRAMPALAAAAAVVFVAVLATDVSTRDSDGERQAASRTVADSAIPESMSTDDRALEFGTDGDDAASENSGTAAGGTAAGSPAAAEAAAPDVAPQPPQPSGAAGSPVADAPADASDGAARDSAGELSAATTEAEAIESADAASQEDDGGDGNRMGFLVVEIAAGALAIGAVAIFIASRRRKSEG
jgi:hypothetical protein